MSNTGRLLFLAIGMGLLATCHQSILTAPPGSEIVTILANPIFIPANGGVSVITVVVYDATGQPVPDGTVVQFFTDLGRVQEQGKTNDGVAQVNLVADGRSGKATVTAVVGGGAAPPATTTPTTTPTTTLASSSALAPSAITARLASSSAAAATAASENVVVTIGTANPSRVLVAADPRNIASNAPRFSTVTATVIDERGNPIANVPVVFFLQHKLDQFEETLESRGLPVYTDNNGQARDKVFTSRPRDAGTKIILVSAQAVAGTAANSPNVEIGVNF